MALAFAFPFAEEEEVEGGAEAFALFFLALLLDDCFLPFLAVVVAGNAG